MEASLPEVRLGATLSRFWVVEEEAPLTGVISYGVLDLRTMDVLERGGDLGEIHLRVREANTDSILYLREIKEEQERREAVRIYLGKGAR